MHVRVHSGRACQKAVKLYPHHYHWRNTCILVTGVMMSRSKSSLRTGSEVPNAVAQATATTLSGTGILAHCLQLLKTLLDHWKNHANLMESEVVAGSADGSVASAMPVKIGSNLLKPQHQVPPPDMSPFFLRQYIKVSSEVCLCFSCSENYIALLILGSMSFYFRDMPVMFLKLFFNSSLRWHYVCLTKLRRFLNLYRPSQLWSLIRTGIMSYVST